MNNPFTEQRVSSLEISMADLKEIVAEVSRQVAMNCLAIKESQMQAAQSVSQLSLEMKDFKQEMLVFKDDSQDFKDEMLTFKDEMKDFKDEMKDFKDEMRTFKDEMKVFKDEMKDFKDEMTESKREADRERRRHNLELGKIANKQGRMAEDLVAPSVCRIMKQALGIDKNEGCLANVRVIRPFRGDRKKTCEFDVIAECKDYVLVNETKSSLTARDVQHLLRTISRIRDYFPEFSDRKLIGAVASLHVAKSVVNFATKNGVLALAVGAELMDIQNPEGFRL